MAVTITRDFALFLNAGTAVAPVIHVNQYDRNERWQFTLYDENGAQYTPDSGAIVGIKADGLGIINTASISGGKVIITETQQMTAAAGDAVFELTLNGSTHGTANFIVRVEAKPGDNASYSASDISLMEEALTASTQALNTIGSGGVLTTGNANSATVSTLQTSEKTLVGALNGLNTNKVSFNGTVKSNGDLLDTSLTAGFYFFTTATNIPSGAGHNGYLTVKTRNGSAGAFRVHEYQPYNEGTVYVNMLQNSQTWTGWKALPSRDEMNASWANYGVKNLLRFSGVSKTDSGLTFTVNNDGSVTVSGTNTASSTVSFFITAGHPLSLPVGKYVLTGAPSGGGTSGNTNWFMSLYYNDNMSNNWGIFDFGEGATYNLTASTNTKLDVRIGIGAGKTVNNLRFYPMLRPASIADDTYVPYAPNNAELNTKALQSKGSLPSMDLNDLLTVGVYRLNGGVTYQNAPMSFGILEVINADAGDGTNIMMQRLTTTASIFTRYRSSGTWYKWRRYDGTEMSA